MSYPSPLSPGLIHGKLHGTEPFYGYHDLRSQRLKDKDERIWLCWLEGVVKEPLHANTPEWPNHPGCLKLTDSGTWRIDLVAFPAVWVELSRDLKTAKGRLSDSRFSKGLIVTRPTVQTVRITEDCPEADPLLLPNGWLEFKVTQELIRQMRMDLLGEEPVKKRERTLVLEQIEAQQLSSSSSSLTMARNWEQLMQQKCGGDLECNCFLGNEFTGYDINTMVDNRANIQKLIKYMEDHQAKPQLTIAELKEWARTWMQRTATTTLVRPAMRRASPVFNQPASVAEEEEAAQPSAAGAQ